MITGYNTDVSHADLVFHVQTEDKGVEVACIESLVYVGGQILGKRRTSYREVVEASEGRAAIVDLMDRQHRLMIAGIRGGEYDEKLVSLGLVTAPAVAEEGTEPPSEPIPISEESPFSPVAATGESQTLDQMILDYLNSEAEQEHLVLMMDVAQEFRLGETASMRFRTKGSITGEPVPSTLISVKMISTVSEPLTLAQGETDLEGELDLSLKIPDLKRGSSALIVTASSEMGTAEIKHLL